MKIGIIGGGIAGLTAGYELIRAGHEVTVLERDNQLGGQVGTLEVGGARIERFYHHIFTSDTEIIRLIDEMGLQPRMEWVRSKVGYFRDGKVFDFVTPLDLLKFHPLGLVDRLRLGLVSVYLQRQSDWKKYEETTAKDWLTRYFGKRNFDVIWGPLLRGKFGESYDQVGMVWFWGKMRLRFGSREKGMQSERLGYLDGSFGLLIDELVKSILRQGGRIYTEAAATRIIVRDGKTCGVELNQPEAMAWKEGVGGLTSDYEELQGECLPFDSVIATVPSPVFLDLVPELPQDYADRLGSARYQSAICTVLTLSRPLSHIYWLNISDAGMPFVAVIEHTNLIEPARYGGKHIVYVSNYLSKAHPLYRQSPGDLLQTYEPYLQRINPDFNLSWVESYRMFRDDSGQPIVGTNYSRQVPDMRVPIDGLYLANTTQIYPEDRGMNYSVRLGRRVAELVTRVTN